MKTELYDVKLSDSCWRSDINCTVNTSVSVCTCILTHTGACQTSVVVLIKVLSTETHSDHIENPQTHTHFKDELWRCSRTERVTYNAPGSYMLTNCVIQGERQIKWVVRASIRSRLNLHVSKWRRNTRGWMSCVLFIHVSLHVFVYSPPHTHIYTHTCSGQLVLFCVSICGHACVVNVSTSKCLSFTQTSVCVWEAASVRNGCIFRLLSMQWDSTLQALAASQTPLLPRKHAAAWQLRGATQFNRFWPFSDAGACSLWPASCVTNAAQLYVEV